MAAVTTSLSRQGEVAAKRTEGEDSGGGHPSRPSAAPAQRAPAAGSADAHRLPARARKSGKTREDDAQVSQAPGRCSSKRQNGASALYTRACVFTTAVSRRGRAPRSAWENGGPARPPTLLESCSSRESPLLRKACMQVSSVQCRRGDSLGSLVLERQGGRPRSAVHADGGMGVVAREDAAAGRSLVAELGGLAKVPVDLLRDLVLARAACMSANGTRRWWVGTGGGRRQRDHARRTPRAHAPSQPWPSSA